MSLEAALAALTAAVQANTETMTKFGTMLSGAAITPPPAAAPAAPFVPPTPAAAPPPTQPAMPAAPAWAAPPAPAGIPFSDTNGLVKYMTDAYDALKGKDPGVGAKIQAAFTTLGYADVQHVQPHHFQEVYNRIESLR